MPKAKFSKGGGDFVKDVSGVFRLKLIKCEDSRNVDDCWDWIFEITEPGDPNEGKLVGGLTSAIIAPNSKAYNYLRGLGMPELDPEQDLDADVDTDDFIGCEGDGNIEINKKGYCNVKSFNMPRKSQQTQTSPRRVKPETPATEEEQTPRPPAAPKTEAPRRGRQAPAPRVTTPADEDWDDV